MNDRKPKLSYHAAAGQWFVKYAGRFHYLGKDQRIARAEYARHIIEWAKWRAVRDRELAVKRPKPAGENIASIFARFMAGRAADCSEKTLIFYQSSLRRFLHVYGTAPPDALGAEDLEAFKTQLVKLGLSKKTINHEIGAVKTLLRWAMDMNLMPMLNMRAVKPLRIPPPPKKGYTIHDMRRLFCSVATVVKPWIAVNWLTAARPTEVVRLVNQRGEWEEPGIFRLLESKTSGRSMQPRHLVLSDLALTWLDRCEPVFSREDSYYRATSRAGWIGGPHPLRHGAATHLLRLGEARADIDIFLGHMPQRVSLTYAPIEWQPLRATAARLTL